MTIRTGNDLGTEVCESLGLNPNTIRTIQLRMDVNEVAEVTTVGFVYTDRPFTDAVRKYVLIPRAGWGAPWGPPLRRPAPWAAHRPQLGDVYYTTLPVT